MHSDRSAIGAGVAPLSQQFARLARVDGPRAFGDRIAYDAPPTAEPRSHGGSRQTPKRGETNDETNRRRTRAHVAPVGRADHRVRDVGDHLAVRGHRERGRQRRRVSRVQRIWESRAAHVCAALFAIVCLLVAAGEAPADDGVYRRPIANDPATLDPALIADVYGRAVAQQIFDGLVSFDQTLAITPSLASFWRASRDGLTCTFMLRKGVRFHHGRELTADDVVYSLTRVLDPRLKSGAADLFTNIRGAPEFRRGEASSVTGLMALDRYTVQVSLTETTVPFVSLLAVGQAKIVPRDVAERDAAAFGGKPVGTGPVRFQRPGA